MSWTGSTLQLMLLCLQALTQRTLTEASPLDLKRTSSDDGKEASCRRIEGNGKSKGDLYMSQAKRNTQNLKRSVNFSHS